MATFTVLAGDFAAHGQIRRKKLLLRRKLTFLTFLRSFSAWEKVPFKSIRSLQIASEQSSKSFNGAAMAGLAGGLLLGPVGLAAGVLAGGNKRSVMFELRLDDGRGLLGECDPRTYRLLQAAAFKGAA